MNQTIAKGLIEGEGPVVTSDGSFWAVEMASGRACVSRVSGENGVVPTIDVGGRSNSMTADGSYRQWGAEARFGAVICFDGGGRTLKTIVHPDHRFLWSNDLRFGPNELLYLTDLGVLDTDYVSGTTINPLYRNFDFKGCIFEIDPVSGTVLRKTEHRCSALSLSRTGRAASSWTQ